MLKVATRSWHIWKVHEQDRVDILESGCLVESGAISVDMEERISGRKRTKRCLYYWLDIGRIQDDEPVDGHLSQAVGKPRPRILTRVPPGSKQLFAIDNLLLAYSNRF